MKSLQEEFSDRRVGVVLSAGFFGFFAHAGLVAALERAGVRPAVYTGASAGALVGAYAGGGMPAAELSGLLTGLRRADFWDRVGPRDLLGGRLPAAGLLRGERFLDLLRTTLPCPTFEACPTPVMAEAVNLTAGRSEVLCSGDLATAVWASCAYPGLFPPARRGASLYYDGGLVNKAPITCVLGRVDALLVHWLSSNELSRPLARGIVKALVRGVAVARRENSRLQARLALAHGLDVYVLCPKLPRVGPSRLHHGGEAIRAAADHAAAALGAPAQQARLDPDALRMR